MELAAIVHALNMWRHYLLGRRFVLMTDHSELRYLFDQPKLDVRQARWMALLSEFDFEIKHIKGKENRVVDALSRSMKVVHLAVVSASESNIFSTTNLYCPIHIDQTLNLYASLCHT
jgi:hypothetical protein